MTLEGPQDRVDQIGNGNTDKQRSQNVCNLRENGADGCDVYDDVQSHCQNQIDSNGSNQRLAAQFLSLLLLFIHLWFTS